MQRPDLAKTVPATERRPTTCPLPGDEDGAHVPAGRSDSNPGRARCVYVFQPRSRCVCNLGMAR